MEAKPVESESLAPGISLTQLDRAFFASAARIYAAPWRGARRSLLVSVLATTLGLALVGTGLAAILAPQWMQLAGYFWYSIPANSFMHLPSEPAVLYAGSIFEPWLVAAVGGFSTLVASVVDYYAVRRFFEIPWIKRIKRTSLFGTTLRWFRWRPWETTMVFAFAPLPFDAVRVLAPSSNYPLGKYVTATVTGRVLLFYLLATGGAWLPFSSTYLLLIGLSIALVPLLGVLWVWGGAFISSRRIHRLFIKRG